MLYAKGYNGYMKLIIGITIYALSIATIIVFMMGASIKDKESRNES